MKASGRLGSRRASFLLSAFLAGPALGVATVRAEEPAQPGTAADWNERWSEPFDSPRFVEVITAEEIRASQARNLPDLLDQRRVAWMTFANYGGGSPTIRGLDGFDVTILLDGVPIATSTYRFADLEFLSTIDLEIIERIEIVPGAAGAAAGWGAGPVIHLFTRRSLERPDTGDELLSGSAARVAYRFATVDKSSVARVEANRRGAHTNFLFGLTSRDIGDLKAGEKFGFQRVTGYEEVAGNARLQYFPSPRRTVELDVQILEQQNVPQYERVEAGTYLEFRLNPRKRALFKLSYLDVTERWWADRVEVFAYLNQHRQQSFEQLAVKPEIRTRRSDNDDVEGVRARLDLARGRHRISYGADYSREEIQAVRRHDDTLTGEELVRGPDRTRDGQGRDLVALWVRDRISISQALTLTAESRWASATVDGPYVGPAGAFELDLAETGLAASFGLSWHPTEALRLSAAWDTGFRPPVLDEVGGVSLDPAVVGVPNDDLEAISVDSLELGIGYRSRRIDLRAAYFRTEVDHAAVLVPATVGGSTFLDLDRDGFQDPDEPSFVRAESTGRAELDGLDLAIDIRPLEELALFGSWHAVEGEDPRSGVPLAAIPPDFGRLGARWSPSWRWFSWVEVELRFYGDKSRLGPGELRGATARGNAAPSSLESAEILEITAALELSERFRLLLSMENPSDEAYRPYGSFLIAGGQNLVVTAEYDF